MILSYASSVFTPRILYASNCIFRALRRRVVSNNGKLEGPRDRLQTREVIPDGAAHRGKLRINPPEG